MIPGLRGPAGLCLLILPLIFRVFLFRRTHHTHTHTEHCFHLTYKHQSLQVLRIAFQANPSPSHHTSHGTMSNQSLADTFSSTVKRVEKTEKPGSGVIAPPHFGDLGKAANDTFSKVLTITISTLTPPNWGPFNCNGRADCLGLSYFRCV